MSPTKSTYKAIKFGSKFTNEYAVYIKSSVDDKIVSAFHDIPLHVDKQKRIYNMVVEIPRWSFGKFEISRTLPLNPIVQDRKADKLRYVANVFPFCGYPWNYGALPQTWEDVNHIDQYCKARGDNDPLDVIEIGSKLLKTGKVVPVKIVGCLALIDEGETDWKMLAISQFDPLFDKINCISDIEKYMPSFIEHTKFFLRSYKVPDGKPFNNFGMDGQVQDSEFAQSIVDTTHEQWKKMISGETPVSDISIKTRSCDQAKIKMSDDELSKIIAQLPSPDMKDVGLSISLYTQHHVIPKQ